MDDNDISYFVQSLLRRSVRRVVNSTPRAHYFRGTFNSDDLLGNKQLTFNLNGGGGARRRLRRRNFLFCFVVNTVSYGKVVTRGQVGHWLAIAIRHDGCRASLTLHFFDSFGRSPTDYAKVASYVSEVKSKCALHQVKFTCDRLNKPLQAPLSKLCGLYAARAAIHVWEHSTLPPETSAHLLKHSFSRLFGDNRNHNDLKMERYLYKEWYGKGCHNRPSPWKMVPIARLMKTTQPPGFCPKGTLGLLRCRMDKCGCH